MFFQKRNLTAYQHIPHDYHTEVFLLLTVLTS